MLSILMRPTAKSLPPKPLSKLTLRTTTTTTTTMKEPQPFDETTTPHADRLIATLDTNPPIKILRNLHTHLMLRSLAADPPTSIKLMRAYAARGDTVTVRSLFDGIPQKTVVSFNVLIRSYVNNGLHREALLAFRDMSAHRARPDNYTFPCALKACSCGGEGFLVVGRQIHAAALKPGLDANLYVGNALITMYFKCARSSADARRVFSSMARDVVSWNSLIAGLAQNGEPVEAVTALKEMVGAPRRVEPDGGTLASVLPALTSGASVDDIAFVGGVFDGMRRKVSVAWNAMIAAYVNNSMPAEALMIFNRMEAEGAEPNEVTYASVIPACGDHSALGEGRRVHEQVEAKGLRPNIVLENALIDMYAKCGRFDLARGVFESMRRHDIVSWTSMVSAYGMHGHGEESLRLFEQMLGSGLSPDAIAFVAVLSACSHSGLLDEGRGLFDRMVHKYRIVPRLEHFSCMVDLFGRAGQVEEAYEVIKKMPMNPNDKVWGALLGGCRAHSNTSIGLVAADELFKLSPKESGCYVLLSNIYAKAKKWDKVETVRNVMKIRGVAKAPGSSKVELGNTVHTFLIGDQSHPQSKEIYTELDALSARMKEAGYVTLTESALHDVEEEDKEGHLAVHSEKLAIAFAIINTEPGTPILITKNLRICDDCHRAIKVISAIAGREIIVRDTNRFHRFEVGACSCGDYW